MRRPALCLLACLAAFAVGAPMACAAEIKLLTAGAMRAVVVAVLADFDKLLERLGSADQVRPKAKLKAGGYVAELVASGEAEIAIHQISEIVPVKGVTLAGPLPAEIQNSTVYAGGIGAAAKDGAAAK